jgi:uncharacterized protein YdeI (YjbR/CyaY-like superfamily)
MTKRNPKVDAFIGKAKQWREEYAKLRTIIQGCGLDEELKWGVPCYSMEGRNVVLIHGFKDYCAVLFMKGALLKDPEKILIQQTENVQAARQVRFGSVGDIAKVQSALKACIQEAIGVEKAGLKVTFKKTSEFSTPVEFQEKLDGSPSLKAAFKSLTPGRQRAYLMYFSRAKQSATRASRVERCLGQILKGKGLLDD